MVVLRIHFISIIKPFLRCWKPFFAYAGLASFAKCTGILSCGILI